MKRLISLILMIVMFSWLADVNRGLLQNIRNMFLALEYGMVVRSDMLQLAQAVRAYHRQKQELPEQNLQHVLLAYLRYRDKAISRAVGRDAWGTLYRLLEHEQGFAIISAGPDRLWETDDDIVRIFSLEP